MCVARITASGTTMQVQTSGPIVVWSWNAVAVQTIGTVAPSRTRVKWVRAIATQTMNVLAIWCAARTTVRAMVCIQLLTVALRHPLVAKEHKVIGTAVQQMSHAEKARVTATKTLSARTG